MPFFVSCLPPSGPLCPFAMRTIKPQSVKQSETNLGGLSAPSKMPCLSFNIPAKRCKVGSKLRAIEGSVCSSCYALKGRYGLGNVEKAMERRFKLLMTALETFEGTHAWIMDFAKVLNWHQKEKGQNYFRWHDSGDIQSVAHLRAINAIAFNCPTVRFWLPTREKVLVSEFLRMGEMFNENLTVRLSAPMIDENMPPLPAHVSSQVRVSLVYTAPNWGHIFDIPSGKFACPSSLQANACGDCRACWLSPLPIVYKAH